MPAWWSPKRFQSSASSNVENFAITVRDGRWIRSDWPFIPSAA